MAGDTGSAARSVSVSGISGQTIAAPAKPAANQREKHRAPTEAGLQHAAEQRRQHRRQRHHRADQRQFAAGARAGIKIAHDGARQHDAAGAAERLQRARRDQHLDRGRQRASKARRAIKRHGAEQHRLTAVPVGERTVENLADGEAEQIGGDRELRLRGRGAQQPRDVRQRRQVHVGGERPDRAQRRQQYRERESTGTQHGR